MSVRVGIVDGGVGTVAPERLAASARFVTDHDGDVDMIRETHLGPALRHGELVAALVLAAAPTAILIDARVASATDRPTARSVAAAIDWCVAEGARIVNLSLGLVDDRAVLRDACARALAGGVTLIAAAPARGAAVYPAGYPGVLSVCGDARCADAQWSLLGGVTGAWRSVLASAHVRMHPAARRAAARAWRRRALRAMSPRCSRTARRAWMN